MIRAGELVHKIDVQENRGDVDAVGQREDVWGSVIELPAKIAPASGAEVVAAGHVSADVTHLVTTRWIDGIVPQMRVVHAGRVFEIVSVINVDERSRDMLLHCVERS